VRLVTIGNLPHHHGSPSAHQFHQVAPVTRRKVLDDHEREVGIGRESPEQALQRGNPAG
jgi:hypothetical protein